MAERRALFEEVWQRIADHYLYQDFRGLDWQAVYDEFAVRIGTAPDDRAFYTLMEEMVGRLNDQHSRFLPPSAAQREDVRSSGIEAQVGIGVLAVPGKDGAWIQHVFPNGPAAEAGLQARDRIVAIDGAFVSSANMIHGVAGSRVRLTVVRPGSETLDVVLTRRPVEGRISPVARRLDGDIGYLAISTLWVQDMPEQVREALLNILTEGDLHGLILDLRGNPGGWQPVLVGILGHFVQGDVGVFFNQQEAKALSIEPNGGPYFYDVPVAVLIDGNTASYAEVLAGILQREAGATVIGLPSAGNTETIYAYELSGGARLWVAQEGFRLQDGSSLEQVGVQPDIVVNVDWTRFSEAQDPITLQALQTVQHMAGQRPVPPVAGGR
jgi:C-terminal peptidase prc